VWLTGLRPTGPSRAEPGLEPGAAAYLWWAVPGLFPLLKPVTVAR
jgi:hypothetical protein